MSLMNRIGLGTIGLVLSLGHGAAVAEVVVVVSSHSTVTVLSKNNITDIFLGRTSRFRDGELAVPIDQAEGSAARDEFYSKFAGKSAAQIKAHWSKMIFTGRGQPPREASNGIDVKREVANNPNAIGYIEQKLVDDSVKVLLSE